MKNNSAIVYRLLLVIGDFLALAAAFSAAYILRVKLDERPLIEQIPAETYLYAILIVLPLWIIVHASIGLYSRNIQDNRFAELGRLILGSFLGILVVLGYDFVSEAALFPARLVVVYGLLLGFGFLLIFRTIIRITRRILYAYGFGVANLLIIGDSSSAKSVYEQFMDTRHSGYRVIGVVGGDRKQFPKVAVYDSLELANRSFARQKKQIHSIIQTKIFKDDQKNSSILSYAQTRHIEYRFIPGSSELYTGNIEVELVREIPMVTVHQTALIGWGRVVKRVFDVLLGSVLLIVFSPLMLFIALLIRFTSFRQPVFLKQTRLTQFNNVFTVYKFRTHKPEFNGLSPEEAFSKLGQPKLIEKYRNGGDHLPNDPRISRLGKILRATSLDELPQLFNVVKGDISLVGPRALVPDELSTYQQRHHILSVKSGLTGLAQVSGRRDISFDERRKLDVYYVQNWSFWLDIVILLKTFRAVIGGVGAK